MVEKNEIGDQSNAREQQADQANEDSDHNNRSPFDINWAANRGDEPLENAFNPADDRASSISDIEEADNFEPIPADAAKGTPSFEAAANDETALAVDLTAIEPEAARPDTQAEMEKFATATNSILDDLESDPEPSKPEHPSITESDEVEDSGQSTDAVQFETEIEGLLTDLDDADFEDDRKSLEDAPVQTSQEDATFSYNAGLHFMASGTALTFSLVGPDWLAIDAGTGEIFGSPRHEDIGANAITITATDEEGQASTTSFDLTIINVNDAPTVTGLTDQAAREDPVFTYNAASHFSNIDTDAALVYFIDGPDWLSIDSHTGQLSGTPTNGDVGLNSFVVRVMDPKGTSVNTSFFLTVESTSDGPLVSALSDQASQEESSFYYDASPHLTNEDGDDLLTFSLDGPVGFPSMPQPASCPACRTRLMLELQRLRLPRPT